MPIKNFEIPILEQQLRYWEDAVRKARLEYDRAKDHLDEVVMLYDQMIVRLAEARKSEEELEESIKALARKSKEGDDT